MKCIQTINEVKLKFLKLDLLYNFVVLQALSQLMNGLQKLSPPPPVCIFEMSFFINGGNWAKYATGYNKAVMFEVFLYAAIRHAALGRCTPDCYSDSSLGLSLDCSYILMDISYDSFKMFTAILWIRHISRDNFAILFKIAVWIYQDFDAVSFAGQIFLSEGLRSTRLELKIGPLFTIRDCAVFRRPINWWGNFFTDVRNTSYSHNI